MDSETKAKFIKEKFDISGWNLSNEREFMENLFIGRFNYFILIFSIFLTAGFANSFDSYKSVVFFAGSVILMMVWTVLYRAYYKHDRTLRIIYQNFPDHPVSVTETIIKSEGYKPRFRASKMMGIYIPAACTAVLLLSGMFVALAMIK